MNRQRHAFFVQKRIAENLGFRRKPKHKAKVMGWLLGTMSNWQLSTGKRNAMMMKSKYINGMKGSQRLQALDLENYLSD